MINGIINSILWGTSGGVSGDAPIITGISVIESSGEYTLSYTYADTESDVQATPLPIAREVAISGTLNTSTSHTPYYIYYNLNGVAEGTSTFKWYEADDINGTGETVVSTASSYSPSDDTKFLSLGVTPVSTLETGIEVRTPYYDLAASFDPFVDISWQSAFNWSTDDLNNYGAAADGTKVNTPVWNGTELAYQFVRASSQRITCNASTGFTVPITTWILFKTPTSYSGGQGVITYSNTHRLTLTSGGVLQLSGTSTGVTLTANSWYVVQWVLNGASSTYAVILLGGSMPADTGISLSTSSIGTPAPISYGSENGGINYFNGYIKYAFTKIGTLSGGEITNMKTYLGVL